MRSFVLAAGKWLEKVAWELYLAFYEPRFVTSLELFVLEVSEQL